MKAGLETFRRRYLAALRRYLKDGTAEHGQAGAELVREALVRGLGERVLVGLHRAAVTDSVPGRAAPSAAEAAAERFFAASLLPVEEAREAVMADNRKQVGQVAALSRRVGRLEEANRVLAVELEESRAAEKLLRAREAATGVELETARRTRDELRVLTRGLLTVQEEERKRISRELHDVVSQALTAINLRLATLDIQTTGDAEEMHRVEAAFEEIDRVARELGRFHGEITKLSRTADDLDAAGKARARQRLKQAAAECCVPRSGSSSSAVVAAAAAAASSSCCSTHGPVLQPQAALERL
jgi:signal transduction histidine kinase